jgi:hypothetical protein
MPKSLTTLVLTASLSLLSAGAARADVYMLEVLQIRPGVSAHHAQSYLGALDLVARRHGGERVSGFRASSIADTGTPRVVGLWRFRNAAALDALLADPNYADISRLRRATFDPEAPSPSTLELIAERTATERQTR